MLYFLKNPLFWFCKFLCLVDLRICFCLNAPKLWLELSFKFNRYSMRLFQRALVGFNNFWIHLSSRVFIEYLCPKYLVHTSKWRIELGDCNVIFFSFQRKFCIAFLISFLVNFGLDWIELDGNASFRVDKIIEKNQINKMHNTSSSSYQSIIN